MTCEAIDDCGGGGTSVSGEDQKMTLANAKNLRVILVILKFCPKFIFIGR